MPRESMSYLPTVEILMRLDRFREGHFVLSPKDDGSMPHSGIFFDGDLSGEGEVAIVRGNLATRAYLILESQGLADFEVVLGIERGGVAFSEDIAECRRRLANKDNETLVDVVHKREGKFVLDEATAEQVRNRRVLLVDDIVTDGTALRVAAGLLCEAGAGMIDATVILDRSGKATPDHMGVGNLVCLVVQSFPIWTEADCRAWGPCSRSVPINTDLGHGAEFLARMAEKTAV